MSADCIGVCADGIIDEVRDLKGCVRAEEVPVGGRTLYNHNRTYCSLAREYAVEEFMNICPNASHCLYADGLVHVKQKKQE